MHQELRQWGNCRKREYEVHRHCLWENVNAEIPQELQELENEVFLQIISGEKPVDYFDTFVVEWYANGGKGADRTGAECL